MNRLIIRQFLIFVLISQWISVRSQNISDSNVNSRQVLDSLKRKGIIFNDNQKKPEIVFTIDQAVKYLQQKYQPQNWNSISDPLRQALGHLIINASSQPFDSTVHILQKFPYDSLSIPWDKFYIWEPMRIKIPVNSFVQVPLKKESTANPDSIKTRNVADSLNINSDNPHLPEYTYKTVKVQKDTSIMVVIDTLHEVTSSYAKFPFRYFKYPYQSDSIKFAVNALLKFLEERDSTIIFFTGKDNHVTPVWFNSRSNKFVRYWLKNDLNDSVTVWIGNPSRDTIGLYLEKEVIFRRPSKQSNYSDARVDVKEVDKSTLLEIQNIHIKPRYWKKRMEANFILNQSALSNWVKGGENSISTSMDITEFVNYENKAKNITSANFARIKLGFLKSGSDPIRKNLDLIETNSKLNHKAFGKFDFSAIMLFKTQVAPGFKYVGDSSYMVSKFFNPATITIGLGLDFKPNKTTSVNFSPLSYKGTFVTDTAHIDQTAFGISRDKKSLNEPGVSLMITNDFNPIKSVTVTNRLQLFTNYIHNPQDVDVDWEMIATARLNWFTDVRFNTHLIYDDDAKTTVLGAGKQPVLNPDGSPKKTARIQFKEMLGLSVVFRF